MSTHADPPFEDSRRLTGPNWHFSGPGATLNVTRALSAAQCERWREGVLRVCRALGWPAPQMAIRAHQSGVLLSFSAPVDQLFAATEVNEWALSVVLNYADMPQPGWPPIHDEAAALRTLRALAVAEREPVLRQLLQAAEAHRLPSLLDDDMLSIGYGTAAQCWPRDALPAAASLSWRDANKVPLALVTGSNGKTTTVRLIAAMLRAQGYVTGHSCTDGVVVNGEAVGSGDYSGPAGARRVLRHPQTQAAVLETARGGILRRGLAVSAADVAVVTNVSAEHFGEYGVDDLGALAEVKLSVARALDARGCLVVNADDPELARLAPARAARLAWFALDAAHPQLQAHRLAGGSTCGVADGQLCLDVDGQRVLLGAVAELPLFAGGTARYNIANAAAAALAAHALGVGVDAIRDVLADFGRRPQDNPGRLERYALGGLTLLLDYAHNPPGLDGLLRVAASTRGDGRLALLLGQAGNRRDFDLAELARVAARHAPDLIVLKGVDGYARGRAEDEVAEHLRASLLALGYPGEQIRFARRELDAVRVALGWARAGDTLVLPVHALSARAATADLLAALTTRDWRAGTPVE